MNCVTHTQVSYCVLLSFFPQQVQGRDAVLRGAVEGNEAVSGGGGGNEGDVFDPSEEAGGNDGLPPLGEGTRDVRPVVVSVLVSVVFVYVLVDFHHWEKVHA